MLASRADGPRSGVLSAGAGQQAVRWQDEQGNQGKRRRMIRGAERIFLGGDEYTAMMPRTAGGRNFSLGSWEHDRVTVAVQRENLG